VQRLALDLAKAARGLTAVPLATWLDLLSIESLLVSPVICELVAKHVSPKRLTLAQAVALACSRMAPVAELGLEWVKGKPIARADDLGCVMALANAGAPRVRELAAGWLVELLERSQLAQAAHLRDLLDARYADVRAKALAVLGTEGKFASDTTLWAALAESPYDDVRAFLVDRLPAWQKAFAPATLRHVWASTLLAIHRGGRVKQTALTQLSLRLASQPDQADQLLPLLAIALRSVRAPERRGALAALTQAAVRTPRLREAIARKLPELEIDAARVPA